MVKLKKPNAIVMDITGTIASRAFMSYSSESRKFMRDNLKEYVIENWGKREFRLALNFVRIEQEQELKNLEKLKLGKISNDKKQSDPQLKEKSKNLKMPLIADYTATKEVQTDSLIANLLWRIDNLSKIKSSALGFFHLNIIEWGYKKGILKTPCYEESAVCLNRWKNIDQIKIYITLGSANFLKLVFSNTTSGDLINLVDGHMNLMEANKKNFSCLSEMIGEPTSKILYITRIPFDARLARKSNIRSVIIVRNDFDPEAVNIIKNLEKKKKKKKKTSSQSSNSVNDGVQNKQTKNTEDENVIEEQKAIKVNIKSLLGDDNDLSSASKITAQDIQDFIFIQRLDELTWD